MLGKVGHAQRLTLSERPQAVFSTGCLGVKTCISFDGHCQFSEDLSLDPVSPDRHARSRRACPHEGGAGHPSETNPAWIPDTQCREGPFASVIPAVVGGDPSEGKAAWIPAKSKRE